jgi:catechol 2,3-dioxygenase-like lactoylglutathione lyase family enzyme
MVLAFDHVHFYATDPDAARAFWCDVLGAEEVGQLGKNLLLILGGQFIALSGYPPDIAPAAPPAPGDGALRAGFGVAHLGLNVADLEALLPALVAAGCTVHSAPRGEGPLRYVYFTAHDGIVVELTQYVLPRKLRPAELALRGFNHAVHRTKKMIGRALVRAAS